MSDFNIRQLENCYILCICEGKAERAIIDLLLDNDKLIFKRDGLIEKDLSRVGRKAADAEKFLNLDFDKEVVILRILDSRKENFKLNKLYIEKGIQVINVYTRPEIEMLLIIAENREKDFEKVKNKQKPSDFCKVILKGKKTKSYEYWYQKFENDISLLIKSINRYSKRYSKENDLKLILK